MKPMKAVIMVLATMTLGVQCKEEMPMELMKVIHSESAPAAIGPYSQAIEIHPGRLLYLSGQIAIDPRTGAMSNLDVARETRQVLSNMDAVLLAGGMARWNVIKTTIFLTDMADFGVVNEIYAEYFGDHKPARATISVAALPKGARVEIEAIAAAD